jgi:hypothetical protein
LEAFVSRTTRISCVRTQSGFGLEKPLGILMLCWQFWRLVVFSILYFSFATIYFHSVYVGSNLVHPGGVKAPTVSLRSSPTAKSNYLDYLRGKIFATEVCQKSKHTIEEFGIQAAHIHTVFAELGQGGHAERNLSRIRIDERELVSDVYNNS